MPYSHAEVEAAIRGLSEAFKEAERRGSWSWLAGCASIIIDSSTVARRAASTTWPPHESSGSRDDGCSS